MIATDNGTPIDPLVQYVASKPSTKSVCERLWLWKGIQLRPLDLALYAMRLNGGELPDCSRMIIEFLNCPAAFDDLAEAMRERRIYAN